MTDLPADIAGLLARGCALDTAIALTLGIKPVKEITP